MTADDSYIQESAGIDSKKPSITTTPPKTFRTGTNCHQQSSALHNSISAVNDSFTPKQNNKATALSSDEVKKSPDAASRSMYSQLSYSQSQTVTDCQAYSSAITVSPYSGGETPLPRDPFQSKPVTTPRSTVAHSPLQDDSFKLSQAITIVEDDHKQLLDLEKFNKNKI